MAVERGEKVLINQELALTSFEGKWFRPPAMKDSEKDYTMGGELYQSLERTLGNYLCLSCPVIDSYLNEICMKS